MTTLWFAWENVLAVVHTILCNVITNLVGTELNVQIIGF